MATLKTLGLEVLPDGSLVRRDAQAARYGRVGLDAGVPNRADGRTETERDRARLGYSPALRRLAGVTQVISPDLRASRLHSRASHTYKVALIAKEIADGLIRQARERPGERVAELIARAGGLDAAACEAAGLAHDLGHAPYGHAGEEALDQVMRQYLGSSVQGTTAGDGGDALASELKPVDEAARADGFEGNPQSFRIVTRLEPYRLGRPGLDLTAVTLAAIAKYPWTLRPGLRKFGAYASEAGLLAEARRAVGLGDTDAQSLEASIMDLADDVAYAIHDLEDFLAAGVVDIGDVVKHLQQALAQVGAGNQFGESSSDDPFTLEAARLAGDYPQLYDDDQYRAALLRVRDLLDRVHDADQPLATIDLRTQLSQFVKRFFGAITLEPPKADGAPWAHLSGAAWHEMQCLKTITRRYIVGRSPMGLLQRSQYRSIEVLFHELLQWVKRPDLKRHDLPATLQRFLELDRVEEYGDDEAFLSRVVVDYICTLSDADALQRARWLSGTDTPNATPIGIQY